MKKLLLSLILVAAGSMQAIDQQVKSDIDILEKAYLKKAVQDKYFHMDIENIPDFEWPFLVPEALSEFYATNDGRLVREYRELNGLKSPEDIMRDARNLTLFKKVDYDWVMYGSGYPEHK